MILDQQDTNCKCIAQFLFLFVSIHNSASTGMLIIMYYVYIELSFLIVLNLHYV